MVACITITGYVVLALSPSVCITTTHGPKISNLKITAALQMYATASIDLASVLSFIGIKLQIGEKGK